MRSGLRRRARARIVERFGGEPQLAQLRVALEALSLEDLSLVWDALSEPYQLSVSYVVQTVSIDSALEPVNTTPVLQKQTVYSKILSMQ